MPDSSKIHRSKILLYINLRNVRQFSDRGKFALYKFSLPSPIYSMTQLYCSKIEVRFFSHKPKQYVRQFTDRVKFLL